MQDIYGDRPDRQTTDFHDGREPVKQPAAATA
jgi:hypothetical protein